MLIRYSPACVLSITHESAVTKLLFALSSTTIVALINHLTELLVIKLKKCWVCGYIAVSHSNRRF